MGVGMTMVIITGGIDVSVGGAMMVTGVTTAKLLVDQGVSLIVAVLCAMLLGALLGLVNGLLIAYGHVHAIIITFGTANLFQFVGRQIFGSQTVNGIPGTLELFGRGEGGRTFGLPHSFVLTLARGRGRLGLPPARARRPPPVRDRRRPARRPARGHPGAALHRA